MRRSVLVMLIAVLLLGSVAAASTPSVSTADRDAVRKIGPFVRVTGMPALADATFARALGLSADTYAVGGGQANASNENFSLSAHIGPQGDFGQVHTKQTAAGVSYMVDVFCVNIHNGNRGVIRGTIKKISPVPNPFGLEEGDIAIFGVKDGGEPSGVPVDDFFSQNGDAFPGLSCKDLIYVGNFNNVNQGNINVKM